MQSIRKRFASVFSVLEKKKKKIKRLVFSLRSFYLAPPSWCRSNVSPRNNSDSALRAL